MRKLVAYSAAVLVAAVGFVNLSGAEDKEDAKPKYNIKAVMKKCMKGGLCKKVAGGQATAAEEKELVEMFMALAGNKPPKGEAESWKAKTMALLDAAKGVAGDKEGSTAALKKAANCAACHKLHKPS